MTYEQLAKGIEPEWLELAEGQSLPFYTRTGEGLTEGPFVIRHAPTRLVPLSDYAAYAMVWATAAGLGVHLPAWNDNMLLGAYPYCSLFNF